MKLNASIKLAVGLMIAWCLVGCDSSEPPVVIVYTSQDQVYSSQILDTFERETGIRVKPLYDSEAVKTVGLANRLLAETNQPQCDLFWSNEEMLTRRLESKGVFRESEPIVSVGYRTRRLVANTHHIAPTQYPQTLEELTAPQWKGKVVMAYPMFGTTATHFMALRAHWGDERWSDWCRGLIANEAMFVDGNSVVVKQVASGEAWIGLTDSDDIAAGLRNGYPIASLPLNGELASIPNTIGLIRNGPNPRTAEILRDYLRLKGVNLMVNAKALEGANVEAIQSTTLPMNWEIILSQFDDSINLMKELFLR